MLLVTAASPYRAIIFDVAAGAVLCLFGTVTIQRVFARAPKEMNAATFFKTMVWSEVLKWFVTLVFGALLVQHFRSVGVVIGFALTYFSYFWMILKV